MFVLLSVCGKAEKTVLASVVGNKEASLLGRARNALLSKAIVWKKILTSIDIIGYVSYNYSIYSQYGGI